MSERIELQFLTDVQLLEEIKRQWSEKAYWDWDKQTHSEAHGLAYDYMSGDIEEHIDSLEREYKSRGFELPDRWAYVAQFRPDEEDEQ